MQGVIRSLFNTGYDPSHPLSLFYHCDSAVLHQMTMLSHFVKGHSNNLDRRSKLINDLKDSQQNLLLVLLHMVDTVIPDSKLSRDFRVKYPDDVSMDQLYGSIWFGAECLTAGSRAANHDYESVELKPYAVRLSKCISRLREALKQEENNSSFKPNGMIRQLLKDFDKSWIDFEFRYVSAMSSVQTVIQLIHQQETAVLFSEATHRALDLKYFDYEQVELMDPSIMFAIPRLAIISGLVVFPDGPINPQKPSRCIPACFRPYRILLAKIKDILLTLTKDDLTKLEKALCANDSHSFFNARDTKQQHRRILKPVTPITVSNIRTVLVPTSRIENETSEHRNETDDKDGNESGTEQWRENEYVVSGVLSSASSQELLSKLTSNSTPLQHMLNSLSSGYTSTDNLLHKLFLAISEVADQLQTNFPRDYRAILKYVFQICISDNNDDSVESIIEHFEKNGDKQESVFSSIEFDISLSRRLVKTSSNTSRHAPQGTNNVEWVSDCQSQVCYKCQERFSIFRRRHHCRSCGQVVCSTCSPHTLPLIDTLYKPDRHCTTCYIARLGSMVSSLTSTVV